jgi:hypothetical protein
LQPRRRKGQKATSSRERRVLEARKPCFNDPSNSTFAHQDLPKYILDRALSIRISKQPNKPDPQSMQMHTARHNAAALCYAKRNPTRPKGKVKRRGCPRREPLRCCIKQSNAALIRHHSALRTYKHSCACTTAQMQRERERETLITACS